MILEIYSIMDEYIDVGPEFQTKFIIYSQQRF